MAVVVAQLVERSLPTPEIRGSNQDIGKFLSTSCTIEKTKIKKKRLGMAHLKKTTIIRSIIKSEPYSPRQLTFSGCGESFRRARPEPGPGEVGHGFPTSLSLTNFYFENRMRGKQDEKIAAKWIIPLIFRFTTWSRRIKLLHESSFF